MMALTPEQIDKRIFTSRRKLVQWSCSKTEIDKARMVAELGVLESLIPVVAPGKRAKIEALVRRYRAREGRTGPPKASHRRSKY